MLIYYFIKNLHNKIQQKKKIATNQNTSNMSMPEISSNSFKSFSVATPKYQLFCQEDQQLGIVKELILNIELPLLNSLSQNVKLEVNKEGGISLQVTDMYSLKTSVPFGIFPEKVEANFYSMKGTLILILPVDISFIAEEGKTNSNVTISINQKSEKIPNFEDAVEISVGNEKSKKQPEKNLNKEEATYSSLYKDLTNSLPVVPKESNIKNKKVNRNDVCPCGSGIKFKKCHGK